MMKKLIIINGTMGSGKTAVCQVLYKKLNRSVWLDGDWCWMMNPFEISEGKIAMVTDNITYLLNHFLVNDEFDYVLFDWVMDKQEIYDSILSNLKTKFGLIKITLTCSPQTLAQRMRKDGSSDKKIAESQKRLALFKDLDTQQIKTDGLTPEKVSDEILKLL